MRRIFGVIAAHCPNCEKKVFTTGVGFNRRLCPICKEYFDACPELTARWSGIDNLQEKGLTFPSRAV